MSSGSAAAIPAEAMQLFHAGLEKATAAGEIEPTAMTLATVAESNGVSARVVLLKEATESGFVFYTNLGSNKGRQLAANPRAALVFHWKTTEQQVRLEGTVAAVSDAEADAYFASRSRGSQLGAWASKQSQALGSRAELLARVAQVEARHLARPVPRPEFWSGFRLQADMIEFWYGKPSRLHDRFRFTLTADGWQKQRLFP